MTVKGIVAGALAGLLVTIMVTAMWPPQKLRWLRPLAGPLVGFGIAYVLMTQVH